MIGADDEAMIMDFGIARSTGAPSAGRMPGADTIVPNLQSRGDAHDATMSGAVVGTVEYMAPEQAKGQPVDQRADIYAFGLDPVRPARRPAPRRARESAMRELQARMEQRTAAVKSLLPESPRGAATGSCRGASNRTREAISDQRGTGRGSRASRRERHSDPAAAPLYAADDRGGVLVVACW